VPTIVAKPFRQRADRGVRRCYGRIKTQPGQKVAPGSKPAHKSFFFYLPIDDERKQIAFCGRSLDLSLYEYRCSR